MGVNPMNVADAGAHQRFFKNCLLLAKKKELLKTKESNLFSE
jgi:hypothetical protein